jgi:hypothetical protein
MKTIRALCSFLAVAALLAAAPPQTARAAGWDDALRGLSDDGIIDNGLEDGSVYTADYSYSVTNRDGIANNFGGSDTVNLTLTSVYDPSMTLSCIDCTRDELRTWAQDNADLLYAILFLGSPDRSITGETLSSALATHGVGRLLGIPMHDIRLSAQYDFFKVGPGKIATNGPSGLLSFVTLGESGRHAIGLDIPYRALTADDQVDTTLIYLMLNPFYEYSVTAGPNRLTATASVNVGATSIDSELFGGRAGFVNYGATVGAGLARTLVRGIEGRAGIAYQYLDRWVPESQMPDDFQWLGEALNDAKAENSLTPGVGVTAWIAPETASIDLNVYHVYQLGSDVEDDFKNQTICSAFFTFTPGHWQLRLGYKTSFGLEDFVDNSVVASVRYLW